MDEPFNLLRINNYVIPALNCSYVARHLSGRKVKNEV